MILYLQCLRFHSFIYKFWNSCHKTSKVSNDCLFTLQILIFKEKVVDDTDSSIKVSYPLEKCSQNVERLKRVSLSTKSNVSHSSYTVKSANSIL